MNYQNAVDWKISVPETSYGIFSNEVEIDTHGKTLLNAGMCSKTNTHIGAIGNYYLSADSIINASNFKLIFSDYYSDWKLAPSTNEPTLHRKKNFPNVGEYKTTTKNIIGVCKYETIDSDELVISVSRIDQE